MSKLLSRLANHKRGAKQCARLEGASLLKKFGLILSLLAILSVPLSTFAGAQQINASISGVIADQNKSLIPGAKVLIESAQLAVRRTASTNSDGYFIVTNLPVGLYRVSVEAEGFASFVQENIKVDVG